MSSLSDQLNQMMRQPWPSATTTRQWLWMGLIGLCACAFGWYVEPTQFYYSYLTAYIAVWSTVLAMLVLVMIQHVTDAGWSVVVRRLAEQVLAALPMLIILFLPIAAGLLHPTLVGRMGETITEKTPGLFDWANPVLTAHDHLYQHKKPWLNIPTFLARAAFYFAVWGLLCRVMRGRSLKQDHTGVARLSISMRRWSGPGLIAIALTLSFASFDWVMSLDHHWFSTIFGVYIFAGAAIAATALLSLMTLAARKGPLAQHVHQDTLHALGQWLFAWCVFWAYIAFSQYFLIWYANIPEETIWFQHRWLGVSNATEPTDWRWLSILLPIGQFAIPFLVIMSAVMKRRPMVLGIASAGMLLMHYLDIYWLVMPELHHQVQLKFAWMDAGALAMVGGLCAWAVSAALRKSPAYPIHDPRLQEALPAGAGHSEEVHG